jgi:hypothetical protein
MSSLELSFVPMWGRVRKIQALTTVWPVCHIIRYLLLPRVFEPGKLVVKILYIPRQWNKTSTNT